MLGPSQSMLCFCCEYWEYFQTCDWYVLAFGRAKSLDVAEVRVPTAAILESTLCWCP